MTELKPGYYWVRMLDVEDWEPAMWNGEYWVILGSSVPEDGDFDCPEVIGARLTEPAD